MIQGYDYLALGHKLWPVDLTIKITPKGSAIGFFDDVFGDPLPAVRKMLASGKFSAFRVQMHYEKSHALIDVEQLKKRAALYERLAIAYPAVKFYMSHTTEYNNPNLAAVKVRVKTIKKYAPHCEPVNNPMPGGVSMPDVLEETHNVGKRRKGRFLVSMDGSSVTWKMDVEAHQKRFANAEVNFIWAALFNMAEDGNTAAPKDRKAVPDEGFLRAIVRSTLPAGTPPELKVEGRIKVIPIAKPILMKAFAEDCPGDIRGNKPLLISQSRAASLDIVDCNGRKVSSFKFFGNFTPGLWRHYSGTGSNLYGYQIANKAMKSSGSEWVWARDGNTYYGPFHPQFRKGYFS